MKNREVVAALQALDPEAECFMPLDEGGCLSIKVVRKLRTRYSDDLPLESAMEGIKKGILISGFRE